MIGKKQRTLSRDDFTDALKDAHLGHRGLPQEGRPDDLRGMIQKANQREANQDPVLHTAKGFEALFDQLKQRFGVNAAGELDVRDQSGELTAAGKLITDLYEKADLGDRFWTRPEILKVQVTKLPGFMDPNQLRGEGVALGNGMITAWFEGPSTETLGGAATAGLAWAVEHKGIDLGISGNTSLWDPCPTWRVKVDKAANLIPGDPGREDFKLSQSNRDPSAGGRNVAARALFQAAGVPVGRVRPAELSMRFGDRLEYQGLRTLVESPDGTIRRHFGFNTEGNVYELNWPLGKPATFLVPQGKTIDEYLKEHKATYELKGDAKDDPARNGYDDLKQLLRVINTEMPPAEFGKKLAEIFDVKEWLRLLAVNVAIGNWDGFLDTASNMTLYNSGTKDEAKAAKERDDKAFFVNKPYFHAIPNDFDNAFGISYQRQRDGNFVNWAHLDIFAPQDRIKAGPEMPLISKVLAVPELKQYYVDFLEHFLDKIYKTDDVLKLLGMELPGPSGKGYWGTVQDTVMREGNLGEAPRTRRSFTNDQVYWNGVRHFELTEGFRKIYGIGHHIEMSRESIRAQIKAFRGAGHPKVHDDFPTKTLG